MVKVLTMTHTRLRPFGFVCLLLLGDLLLPMGAAAQASASLTWTSARFTTAVGGDVSHVTEIQLHDDGRTILAAYYGRSGSANLAISTDEGATWNVQAVPGLTQVRTMATLNDGSILIGGTASGRSAPLVRLRRVTTANWSNIEWLSCGTNAAGVTLPLATNPIVWDIKLNAWGDAFISVGSENYDPSRPNVLVLSTADRCETLTAAAQISAQSVLALAIDAQNRIYAATSDTTEHDDPALAGQTRLYYSDDHGRRWTETGRPSPAAKVYHLIAKTDGTLLAGTGIGGGLFFSSDRGATWTASTPIPSVDKRLGNGETVAQSVTRIYTVLELERGWIVIGTGNDMGDLWLSPDNGVTWSRSTPATSDVSNVSWTIAKGPNGTLWCGKGSTFGEIYRATFAPPR